MSDHPPIPPNCPRFRGEAGYSQWEHEQIWACGHVVVWLKRRVVIENGYKIGGDVERDWLRVVASDARCAWLDEAERYRCHGCQACEFNAAAWKKWGEA